ncbi:MAG: hypothetical protein O7I42_10970 [Alphaproteobacteria bacterium]|nr:hypothetical protein [Alphaproteobacteria bacterium]
MNVVLQECIAHLLMRPIAARPTGYCPTTPGFGYRFGSRDRKRRVVTKVNWHPGVPYPDIGFMVAELGHSAERLVAFCNHPGTADQQIIDGMKLIRWTRPSWRKHRNYTLRLKLRALSDNPGNFI